MSSGSTASRGAVPAAISQEVDGSISSTAPSYHVSDGIEVLATFRNRLQQPLRVVTFMSEWHGFKVILRDGAGALFTPTPYSGLSGEDYDSLMQPDEVVTEAAHITYVVPSDADGYMIEELYDSKPISPGVYQIEVRSHQNLGESQELFQEKVADGVVITNTINVTVVADDQPLAAVPRLRKAKPEVASVFRHRGVEMVHADALSAIGVNSALRKERLAMRRGEQQVELPCERLRKSREAKGRVPGPPLAAVRSVAREGYYVPLRYVAGNIGLKVLYDPKKRLYDLKPARAGRV